MRITRWNKQMWKGYLLYHSNYTALWKRQNSKDSKEINGVRDWGRRGWALVLMVDEDAAVTAHLSQVTTLPHTGPLWTWASPQGQPEATYRFLLCWFIDWPLSGPQASHEQMPCLRISASVWPGTLSAAHAVGVWWISMSWWWVNDSIHRVTCGLPFLALVE